MEINTIKIEQNNYITKVYSWMALALSITGIVASLTYNNTSFFEVIVNNNIAFYGLLIAQFACVAYLSSAIRKMSVKTATIVFVGYSILNGITFSIFFEAFTGESIATSFFVTAATFAVMSIVGYVTKSDLTRLGNFAFMALIGLIILSVINLFSHNDMLFQFSNYAGVLVFIGLLAHDTQKIKQFNVIGNDGTDENEKEAIMGALTLYLDFINLFQYFLNLFGNRKSE
ncbi:Bax inhibitor-1/YccA family protein [Lutimonas halocynthiae]|uniref:Bax inhibitor-1/YccA family protein n=1 Tax=Lutimonas halocynthiae TaxID=1446477 RepID=UPI0025B29FFB|nr:Bax inhibitor-1/YccA family protein [Lutimonas halocynthiae]MDN3641559.1 Bax inhibitor-1/YccA family protein [Lutimonas halocynthiae]